MSYLNYLNEKFRTRRTKAEKKAFQEYVLEEVNGQGKFTARVELTGDKKNENIVIGDPLSAKVVCTAHYDTPAFAPFPNIMIPRNKVVYYLYQFVPVLLILAVSLAVPYAISGLVRQLTLQETMLIFLIMYYGLYFGLYRGAKNPNNFNDNTSGVSVILSLIKKLDAEQAKKVAFILFDNEEKGKKGSKAFVKDHKEEMQNRLVVNFDCVANGENLVFIVMEGAEKTEEYTKLKEHFLPNDTYRTCFYPAKGSESNSDHKNFSCGVGLMACRQTKGGMLYTPRIHTPFDTVAKDENIEFISDRMLDVTAFL